MQSLLYGLFSESPWNSESVQIPYKIINDSLWAKLTCFPYNNIYIICYHYMLYCEKGLKCCSVRKDIGYGFRNLMYTGCSPLCRWPLLLWTWIWDRKHDAPWWTEKAHPHPRHQMGALKRDRERRRQWRREDNAQFFNLCPFNTGHFKSHHDKNGFQV